MTDQRNRYLPQDDAISALLREAEIEATEADPRYSEDGISQLLEEAGLHRDPPLAVLVKTSAGQRPLAVLGKTAAGQRPLAVFGRTSASQRLSHCPVSRQR